MAPQSRREAENYAAMMRKKPTAEEKERTIREQTAEVMARLPEDEGLRCAISYMAYEKGHSGGLDEVYSQLVGLVGDLEKPLREFEDRCRREGIKK